VNKEITTLFKDRNEERRCCRLVVRNIVCRPAKSTEKVFVVTDDYCDSSSKTTNRME